MHQSNDVPPAPQDGSGEAGGSGSGPELEVHEIALAFPPMRERDFAALLADMKVNGLREAMWTHEGKVIDGRHRLKGCKLLGIPPRTRAWSGEGSLVEFVLSLNLHRRQLRERQRAMLAARMMPEIEKEARKRQGWSSATCSLPTNFPRGDSRDIAGKILNVSGMSVEHARTVLEKGIPALVAAVDAGKLAVSLAAALAGQTEEEQARLLPLGRKAIAEALGLRSKAAKAKQQADNAPPCKRVEWILENFHAGSAKLTWSRQHGFVLEFTQNCTEEWREALRDEDTLKKLLWHGVWAVLKKAA